MEKRSKISIKKRSQTDWLLWAIIMLQFFLPTLVELLGLPHMLRYSLDVVWVMLFGYLLLAQRRRGEKAGGLGVLVAGYFLYATIVYLFQFQSLWYYLWGVRCNFRFLVAFLAITAFLKGKDVEYFFKAFDIAFWINLPVSLVQYFILGIHGDQLGGIFGIQTGTNGYTSIFFAIVLTRSILLYLNRKEPLWLLLCKSAAALLLAALAEIKFLFFAFLMLVALAVLFTNFTWRKLWAVTGGVFAAAVFAALLTIVFPDSENFLSLDFLLEYAGSDKGYTGDGDVNRLNAIGVINDEWLHSTTERLFGLGLGNCDAGGFDFLLTPFYENYGEMHYHWFSYAFVYLEMGWVGLAFYFAFFVVVFYKAWRKEKVSAGNTKIYFCMTRILAVFCVVLSVHNVSLRTEAGYMMFFALAVPFAMDRENRKKAYLHDKKMDSESAA